MDWKSKINTMVLLTFVLLAAYAVARTAYYDNKTDALAALGDPVTLTGGDCKVLSVEEAIEFGSASGDVVVTYEVQFYRPTYDRRIGTTVVSSVSQGTIENEISDDCDATWTAIQAEPQFQKIDTVVVQYQNETLADLVGNRAYDVVKKVWRNISEQQVES